MDRIHFFTKAVMLAVAILVASAGTSRAQTEENDSPNPLFIDPATRDFTGNPELLQRILKTPHGYFRYINIPFSHEICRRFLSFLPSAPSFNLHGDAHVEQYAITDLGRGLTDFDDSSTGPAVIDLLRFGVSLRLACMANGWESEAEQLYEKFLFGYRVALTDPETIAPEPALVARIKKKFKFDHEKYFVWIDSIMLPMPQEKQAAILAAMRPYIESTLYDNKHLKKEYFRPKKVGYLNLGIGSAQDIKFLVRIEGESDDPYDDQVLEIKEVRDLRGIECITISQKGDPFRVLVGQARIAYEPYEFLGYMRYDSNTFWVHAWVDNYKEIKIEKSFESVEDLQEVAYDVGVQLGRGHTKQIAAPLDIQLRREQIRRLTLYEDKLKETCLELTELVIAAWQEFESAVAQNVNSSN